MVIGPGDPVSPRRDHSLHALSHVSLTDRNPEFAAFNDVVVPLLAAPPERTEFELLHLFAKADD